MTTLDELEKRVDAIEATLERSRPGDLRRAVEKLGEILEDTRLRMSAVERQLEDLRKHMFEATAEAARRHGQLEARIDSVQRELKADLAGLRRDLPSMLADAVREGMKGR